MTKDLSASHVSLLRDAMAGRIGRREVLKRAVALGLSAPAIAGLMLNHGARKVSAQDSPLSGKTIDMAILGIAGWPPSQLGVDIANDLFKPYAQENYGYEVNFSFESAEFGDLFQKAATSLATGEAEYNIIISDSQWLGALGQPGWILQLNDIIAANPELDIEFEPAADAYQIYPDGSDQIWGFPQEGDTIALFVRQDLFSDQAERDAYKATNGDEDLPQTFEEWEQVDIDRFERIAKHFTRPDEDLYGTSMQWSKTYDYVSCYLYPFMFSTGGEIWNQETKQVEGILDSEVNAAAMERNKSFLQYAPPGATNHGIPELVDVFSSGTIATCFQWAAIAPGMMNAAKSEDVTIQPEQVIVVPPPGFKQADGTLKRVYAIGGQPWVINAYNDEDHLQVAIDYMKFWYLPETQLEFARRGGDPAVKSVLDDPEFETLQPHFRAYKYMIREGRSRDFWHDPKYSEMLAAQQEAFSAYVTDQVEDPMQALRYAACTQQQILHDADTTGTVAAPSDACADVSL